MSVKFNINPKIWGPHLWYILHIITFNYPDEPTEYHKRAYHDFFNNLKNIIPCDFCQKHYSKYIAEYPITPHLDKKANVINWLIQIHNFVNLSLNKPTYTPEEVIQIYSEINPKHPFYNHTDEKVKEKTKKKNNTHILILLIFILLCIILYISYYYNKNYYYY